MGEGANPQSQGVGAGSWSTVTFGVEREGKRKHIFVAAHSRLPEGGAPCSLLHVRLSSGYRLSHGTHMPTRG